MNCFITLSLKIKSYYASDKYIEKHFEVHQFQNFNRFLHKVFNIRYVHYFCMFLNFRRFFGIWEPKKALTWILIFCKQ